MQTTHINAEAGTAKNFPLTETEKTWRVGRNCYGMDLLTMRQRDQIHDMKTRCWILENVTPSGVALMYQHGADGCGYAEIYPNGKIEIK
jgi:hypothetical protein